MCNRKSFTILFFLFVLLQTKLDAQDSTSAIVKDSTEVNVQQKGRYAFVLYAGGGMSSYIGAIGSPGLASTTTVGRMHPSGTVRIMWHPDHLLRFGIETGYVNFYTYTVQNGNTSGKVSLTGVPILLVWSMALTRRFNIFAGVGSYMMATDLNYKGGVTSKMLGLGINASVNYVQPITPKLGIAAELKFIDATQTKDYAFAAQLMLVWKFLEW